MRILAGIFLCICVLVGCNQTIVSSGESSTKEHEKPHYEEKFPWPQPWLQSAYTDTVWSNRARLRVDVTGDSSALSELSLTLFVENISDAPLQYNTVWALEKKGEDGLWYSLRGKICGACDVGDNDIALWLKPGERFSRTEGFFRHPDAHYQDLGPGTYRVVGDGFYYQDVEGHTIMAPVMAEFCIE